MTSSVLSTPAVRTCAGCKRKAFLAPGGGAAPARSREAIMHAGPPVSCGVYERATLAAGAVIQGPALIQEYGSTTVVFPGDRCEVAPTGELVIHLAK